MAKNIVKDTSGIIAKVVKKVLDDTPEMEVITQLNFLYTWYVGEGPELDSEKAYIHASVRRLPTRERDIYGKDVELRVNKQLWEMHNADAQYRLIWHELCHINVHVSEDFQVLLDPDGRVSFSMLSHDIVIKTFQAELEKFGLNPDTVHQSSLVSKAYRAYRKQRRAERQADTQPA